ncbi:MAG: hypothetical protein ABI775_05010, partial [Pseudonocardiales bacterium]
GLRGLAATGRCTAGQERERRRGTDDDDEVPVGASSTRSVDVSRDQSAGPEYQSRLRVRYA